jgi:hypothetical protein
MHNKVNVAEENKVMDCDKNIEGVEETQQRKSGKNKEEEDNDIEVEKKYMGQKTKR